MKTSKQQQRNPTIPCQLPGTLLHKVFSRILVISSLAGLAERNSAQRGTQAAPQVALQDLTAHQAWKGNLGPC